MSAADFTRDNYRALLKLAKKHYKFITYDEIDDSESYVLWRHDIDMSVHSSLALAKIEADEEVKSTYFIHLQSAFYNVFEPEISNIIKEIVALGHQIGVHFDCDYNDIEDEFLLEKKLSWEKDILEELFSTKINAFSFHNTSPFTMSLESIRYANMINCYASCFKNDVGYCSDSNGYWKYSRLEDVLLSGDNKPLQILTHPEWWQKKEMTPRERVSYCIDGRAKKRHRSYDEAVK